MSNLIENITSRLKSVNLIIAQSVLSEGISFDGALAFPMFFRDFSDTNKLIDCAEELVKDDLTKLEEVVIELSKAVAEFHSYKTSFYKSIDYHLICENLIKPYKDDYDRAKDISCGLWREYQAKSNRLDYMSYNDEDFKILEVECDTAKAEYDNASANTKRLFNVYNSKRREYSFIFTFDVEFFNLLIMKIGQIATSIIKDIEDIRKENNI